MARILILYSTTDGQTLRICQRLQAVVQPLGHEATVLPIDQSAQVDLAGFDKIVVGASIRYGKHSPIVFEFARRNQALLDTKPNAFFTVNVVARKPEKNEPATNPYMRKFLKLSAWTPRELGVFAGKIDYPKYDTMDRMVIRFIMWMTKGPTQPDAVVEFTDWTKVEAFGHVIAKMQ